MWWSCFGPLYLLLLAEIGYAFMRLFKIYFSLYDICLFYGFNIIWGTIQAALAMSRYRHTINKKTTNYTVTCQP